MLAVVLARSNESTAQYFEFDPGNLVEMTLPMDITQEGVINVVNISDDTLNIEWRKVDNTCPEEDWWMEFCDFGHCWEFLPNGAVMYPVAPGDFGYLRLIVNAQNIPGSGTVHYWVFREGEMAEHVDCFFQLATENFNSTWEGNLVPVTLLWDSSHSMFSINGSGVSRLTLFNVSGQIVKSYYNLKPGAQIMITGIEPGIYFAQTSEVSAPVKIIVR